MAYHSSIGYSGLVRINHHLLSDGERTLEPWGDHVGSIFHDECQHHVSALRPSTDNRLSKLASGHSQGRFQWSVRCCKRPSLYGVHAARWLWKCIGGQKREGKREANKRY